jgi:TBC1 domain family member 20
MLVIGKEAAFQIIESISLLRIRDYMLPSLEPALRHLELLPGILRSADKELAEHLEMLQRPNYALPSALTLYAHEIQGYSDIARLFDFLLAHEPVMSLYLFAAIIISRREKLLAIAADDHDVLFFTLQKLPDELDLEPWIEDAGRLFEQYPPERLPFRAWQRLSSSSVLKTSRSVEQPESLEMAEQHLIRQIEQVHWEERKEKALRTAFRYRRPLARTAFAVAFGAVSIWLRKSGNDRLVVSLILSMFSWVKER